MSKMCQIDVGCEFLSQFLRLPQDVSVVGAVPNLDAFPHRLIRLVLAGDGLPDDCGGEGEILLKEPHLVSNYEKTEKIPEVVWEW